MDYEVRRERIAEGLILQILEQAETHKRDLNREDILQIVSKIQRGKLPLRIDITKHDVYLPEVSAALLDLTRAGGIRKEQKNFYSEPKLKLTELSKLFAGLRHDFQDALNYYGISAPELNKEIADALVSRD